MVVLTSGNIVAVVDDDESILRSLEYLLESADYAVRTFASATVLMESDDLQRIDCLISDIDMPGMDGVELLARLHVVRPELPIILISGYPDRLKRVPPGYGSRAFIKPFSAEDLLAAVAEALPKAG